MSSSDNSMADGCLGSVILNCQHSSVVNLDGGGWCNRLCYRSGWTSVSGAKSF